MLWGPQAAVGPLFLLMVVSVVCIATDWRFDWERNLRERYGIDRDWWVPVLVLSLALLASLVEWTTVETAVREKFDIILLIFTFGILAEGLGASGVFKYVSYKVVAACNGESTRLVLGIFLLTSALTFITSNDIVILLLTPIIVELCAQSGVTNTRPFLLAEFVAANTLSMGMLFGSPTNIIVADEMGIDFVAYLVLMAAPAIIALVSSLAVVWATMRLTQRDTKSNRLLSRLQVPTQYSIPETSPEPAFTKQMRDWTILFGGAVALGAIVTTLHWSLLWCAVPSMLAAIVYWTVCNTHTKPVHRTLTRLPYGVFFFGMTFFIFAEAVSQTTLITSHVVPSITGFLSNTPSLAPVLGVFGTGGLVNLFNDLPAAAIVGDILTQVEFDSWVTELVVTQASLVGLNIGAYVTQIGALAGLIWFNQLRVERRRQAAENPAQAANLEFPTRMDLVWYGGLHFCVAGITTSAFLTLEWLVLHAL